MINIFNINLKKMEDFILNTIDPENFYIEDVVNDNSCFYRAISNSINYLTKSKNLNDIKILKTLGKFKDIKLILDNLEWGYDGKKQEEFARYLQQKSYNWIKKNYMNYLEEYDMDLRTMIYLTHDIDIEEYIERYKYFAGDDVITENEDELENRWGGTPEQISLSQSYQIPIIIMTSQKYDENRKK